MYYNQPEFNKRATIILALLLAGVCIWMFLRPNQAEYIQCLKTNHNQTICKK